MTTLWDTTGTDVVTALAAERRAAGALAFRAGAHPRRRRRREAASREAEAAATAAAAAHPCRLLIVVRRQSGRTPAAARRRGPDRRPARARRGGRHADVRPAGAARRVRRPAAARPGRTRRDLVARRPAPDKIAYDPLGVLADRRVTDSAAVPRPAGRAAAARRGLRARRHRPGVDADHQVARPARARLRQRRRRAARVVVSARGGDPSAALLAGWLGAGWASRSNGTRWAHPEFRGSRSRCPRAASSR